MAVFRNDSGFAVTIDRFGLYVPAEGEFEISDVDAESLSASPLFARVDGQPASEGEQGDDEGEQGELEQSDDDAPADEADPVAEPVEDEPALVETPAEPDVEPVDDFDSFGQL